MNYKYKLLYIYIYINLYIHIFDDLYPGGTYGKQNCFNDFYGV